MIFDISRMIFDIIKRANWLKFQILTKRSERFKEFGEFMKMVDYY